MLVEADAIIAETVHFLPGLEVFGVGAQIEDKDLHGRVSLQNVAILPYGGSSLSGYGQSRCLANRRKKIPYMWNGGFRTNIAAARDASHSSMAKALKASPEMPGPAAKLQRTPLRVR